MITRASLLLLALLAGFSSALAQNAVVFKDGFTLKGKVDKERDVPQHADVFNRTYNFDFLNSGPKFIFFSTHVRKGAQVVPEVKEEKKLEFTRWYNWLAGTKKPLPAMGPMTKSGFNSDWVRTIEVSSTDPRFKGVERITQVITYLSPTAVKIDSSSHKWREVYDPRELGPTVVRNILATHPDLSDGWVPAPDPMKRVTIAQFLMEVGWYSEARAELARAKKDCPWAWSKEASDRFDKVTSDIDAADTRWVLGEVETALTAGQYQAASAFLKDYQPKSNDAKDLNTLAVLKAKVEELQPRFELTRRLLRELIDRESGLMTRNAYGAIGGGNGFELAPKKTIPPNTATLLEGAEAVYREMHPDTLNRVERFAVQVKQEDDRAKANKDPSIKPDELLSLAVSGWLMGTNGARQDPVYGAKVWRTRQMIANYLREGSGNERTRLLDGYLKSSDQLTADELAQIVTLLPPIEPEDPANIRGERIDPKEAGATDVFKINTGPLPEDSAGVTYYVRLPREYHHGRSYPLILAMNDPTFGAEKMIGLLAAEADRNGYIIAAPEWTARFGGKQFDYSGKDHRLISSTIRDLSRKFQIDQDRVFAFGWGAGANFALDLSMSRPDLLAGVVAMGAYPVHQFYQYYWKNAQKCPVYCVTGEMFAQSIDGLRRLYESWLPLGFYSILSVYKGRGAEWYAAEVPQLFDWMNRKARVRGLGSLRLDGKRFESWQTFRDTDTRFYWVGATELSKGNRFVNAARPDRPPLPAEFFADLRDNEIIVSNVRGTKKITVWLERDMIDWTKPLKARVDGDVYGFKPRVMTQDVKLMLEELYRTGDRKMLFFGMLEFRTQG